VIRLIDTPEEIVLSSITTRIEKDANGRSWSYIKSIKYHRNTPMGKNI